MKITTGSETIGKPYAAIHSSKYGGLTGHYIHDKGIVIITFNTYPAGHFTLLWFAYKGRMYRKNIKGPKYTKIGLARIAGKFINEVVNCDNSPNGTLK